MHRFTMQQVEVARKVSCVLNHHFRTTFFQPDVMQFYDNLKCLNLKTSNLKNLFAEEIYF